MELISDYISRVRDHLDGYPQQKVVELAELLLGARQSDSMIFVLGNGGSATTASHAVNDWMIGSGLASPGLRVINLAESVAQISAIGNDDCFENVFSRPFSSLLRGGDLLVVFSASGNSPNVIRALDVGKERGLTTIAVVGFDGGAALKRADFAIHFASPRGDYGVVEDLHLILVHLVKEVLIASAVD